MIEFSKNLCYDNDCGKTIDYFVQILVNFSIIKDKNKFLKVSKFLNSNDLNKLLKLRNEYNEHMKCTKNTLHGFVDLKESEYYYYKY